MPFLQEQKTARVGTKKALLGVACMDAGNEREQGALSLARRLFRITKLLSSRLAYKDIGNERELGAVSVD